MSQAFVLIQETEELLPLRQPAPLPIGSILLAGLASAPLDALACVFAAWSSSPWCPVALLTPERIGDAALNAIRLRGMRLASLPMGRALLPSAAEIRFAVASRPLPTHEDICEYLDQRAGAELATLVRWSLGGEYRRSVLRRRLARCGSWSPRDWRNVATAVELLSASMAGAIAGLTQERVALEAGRTAKTVSRWCQAYFRMPWRELLALGAWEPTLEQALRSHGYAVPGRVTRTRCSGEYVVLHLSSWHPRVRSL